MCSQFAAPPANRSSGAVSLAVKKTHALEFSMRSLSLNPMFTRVMLIVSSSGKKAGNICVTLVVRRLLDPGRLVERRNPGEFEIP
jgi:hypothetical protein